MATEALCTIAGCGKTELRGGLCAAHYRKKMRRGDPLAPDRRLRPPKTCSVAGCGADAGWRAGGKRGMCLKHWARWRHNGDPEITRKSPNGSLEAWLVEHQDHHGDDCLIWPFGRAKDGYAGYATVGGIVDYAYRHMCSLVHGEPPSGGHQARHSCGNGHRGCVHPEHVSWGTPVENQADRLLHGTDARGSKSTVAILSEDDVRTIRALAGTVRQKDLAERFGVQRTTIYNVVARKSWAWLP